MRPMRCFEDVPARVQQAVDGLRYNTINIVFIAVNNESLLDRSALYIPDPGMVAHRLCLHGFFQQRAGQAGNLVADRRDHHQPGRRHSRDVRRGLDRTRDCRPCTARAWSDKRDVIVTDVTRSKYGYPVYDLDYKTTSRS